MGIYPFSLKIEIVCQAKLQYNVHNAQSIKETSVVKIFPWISFDFSFLKNLSFLNILKLHLEK